MEVVRPLVMRGASPSLESKCQFQFQYLSSGRKIIQILKKNPKKDPEKYGQGTSVSLLLVMWGLGINRLIFFLFFVCVFVFV